MLKFLLLDKILLSFNSMRIKVFGKTDYKTSLNCNFPFQALIVFPTADAQSEQSASALDPV